MSKIFLLFVVPMLLIFTGFILVNVEELSWLGTIAAFLGFVWLLTSFLWLFIYLPGKLINSLF